MVINRIVYQTTNLRSKLLTSHPEFKATWYDGWHPALDEALQHLPETDVCPHELFRLLMQNPGFLPKRSVLVTEHGAPVAVVGLRQNKLRFWPVTNVIIPGIVFPAKPGYLVPVLEALGVDISVTWWRMGEPPSSRLMRNLESTPTNRMHLSDDYERYWRKSSLFKNIRQTRNRCRPFTLAVNLPGLTEWTIRNCHAKWNPNNVNPYMNDRILFTKYLENRGKSYTLSLLDQDKPVAGAIMVVHNNDLVGTFMYRKPEYDWYGVGMRIMDLSFSFAAESGFETLDMGPHYNYKDGWAPPEGKQWSFDICPEYLFRAKQLVNWTRNVKKDIVSSETQIANKCRQILTRR